MDNWSSGPGQNSHNLTGRGIMGWMMDKCEKRGVEVREASKAFWFVFQLKSMSNFKNAGVVFFSQRLPLPSRMNLPSDSSFFCGSCWSHHQAAPFALGKENQSQVPRKKIEDSVFSQGLGRNQKGPEFHNFCPRKLCAFLPNAHLGGQSHTGGCSVKQGPLLVIQRQTSPASSGNLFFFKPMSTAFSWPPRMVRRGWTNAHVFLFFFLEFAKSAFTACSEKQKCSFLSNTHFAIVQQLLIWACFGFRVLELEIRTAVNGRQRSLSAHSFRCWWQIFRERQLGPKKAFGVQITPHAVPLSNHATPTARRATP